MNMGWQGILTRKPEFYIKVPGHGHHGNVSSREKVPWYDRKYILGRRESGGHDIRFMIGWGVGN